MATSHVGCAPRRPAMVAPGPLGYFTWCLHLVPRARVQLVPTGATPLAVRCAVPYGAGSAMSWEEAKRKRVACRGVFLREVCPLPVFVRGRARVLRREDTAGELPQPRGGSRWRVGATLRSRRSDCGVREHQPKSKVQPAGFATTVQRGVCARRERPTRTNCRATCHTRAREREKDYIESTAVAHIDHTCDADGVMVRYCTCKIL